MWELKARISKDVKEKLQALAERRYGDRSHESETNVIEDILKWKLKSWQRDDMVLGDWFWLQLAHHAPIPVLRAFAWGKLIEGYFD